MIAASLMGVLALLNAGPMPPVTAAARGAVRAADEAARRLIDDTLALSPTARQLAAELARTDVIAYVAFTLAPDTPRAGTQLVASSSSVRYLRIRINSLVAVWDRESVLAHELWHALEIARAPSIRTQEALRAFYARAATSSEGRDRYETAGARDIERRVWNEVRAGAVDFPVTNGVTNRPALQHPRDDAAMLR